MAKRRKQRVDSNQGDFLDGDGFSRPREAMARAGDPETAKDAPVAKSVEKQRWIDLETFERHDNLKGLTSDEVRLIAKREHPGINGEFAHKRQSENWKDFVNPLIYPVHDKYGIPVKRPTEYKRGAMAFRITPEGREVLKTREWPKRDPERDKKKSKRKKSNRKASNNGKASGVEVDLEL